MSQRTLIEINHDEPVPDTDTKLLAWAKSIRTYIRCGSTEDLPKGFKLFWRRHHADPCPFENPLAFERRYGRLVRDLKKHQ